MLGEKIKYHEMSNEKYYMFFKFLELPNSKNQGTQKTETKLAWLCTGNFPKSITLKWYQNLIMSHWNYFTNYLPHICQILHSQHIPLSDNLGKERFHHNLQTENIGWFHHQQVWNLETNNPQIIDILSCNHQHPWQF